MVIPLVAIASLFALRDLPRSETTESGSAPIADPKGGAGRKLDVRAQDISFDTDELRLEAGAQTVIGFENRDSSSTLHNIAIYEDENSTDPIFRGTIIPGGTDIDYELQAPEGGRYFFQCDVHPSMNGTDVVER